MLSTIAKTDNGSRVLPGDKTGLPWEVWRIILSFLSAQDLCRSAVVCKTWTDLVHSLDHTKWKDLYLKGSVWRHPFWPLNLNAEPHSWRQAYKDRYIASNFWTNTIRQPNIVTCMSVFKRVKNRKVITVGQGKEHSTLKSALAVANDYDKIMVYPGIYDEQFEMSSKIPFELVGCGELGSVILVVCIEQVALTGRVSNLVFRAPWFTNFILKVRAGYLQVDNCILEDGMVYVQNPGTVSVNFCTFRHATIVLQHVNASIIQNCEFSQADSAAITVEGFPKDDRNWTYASMIKRILSTCSIHQRATERHKHGGTATKSAISTVITMSSATTNQKSNNRSVVERKSVDGPTPGTSADTHRTAHCPDTMDAGCDDVSVINSGASNHSHSMTETFDNEHILRHRRGSRSYSHGVLLGQGAEGGGADVCGEGSHGQGQRSDNSGTLAVLDDKGVTRMVTSSDISPKICVDNSLVASGCNINALRPSQSYSHVSHDKLKRIESFVSDCAKFSTSLSSNGSDHVHHQDIEDNDLHHGHPEPSRSQRSLQELSTSDNGELDIRLPEHVNLDNDEHANLGGNGEEDSSALNSSSDGSLNSASGSDVFEEEEPAFNSGTSESDSDGDSMPFSDSDDDFTSSEESVIMLEYPDRHQPRSVSAQHDYVDVCSLNSQNQSEHIDIIQDQSMRKILNEVRGCFIYRCRMTQSKGAVMVSLQANAIILESEINSVGYGIRCIQNSRVVVLKNEIHHCRTSGIFMRLAATGLITGNDIHSNCEAGVDIRKNADPIVQCNRIHHGKRSGVVVLGSGRGQIKHNDIYQNREAGLYILYRGNPTVCNNQIYSGRAAGIAVNEAGRGYIYDNVITGNQWGGIDIRHGGDPIITRNTICNGVSDGIVIGEGGRGSIENNVITGNAGCGVWIMAAMQPLIHGNEIHSNRDTGISLVNRMDSSHNKEAVVLDRRDTQSPGSLVLWNLVDDDPPHHPKQRSVSMATVEYNKVYHNYGKGISCQFGDTVLIQCNAVHANKSDGIYLDQTLAVVVKDNCVSCNLGSGVCITSHGKTEISGNGIYDNRDHGIECQNEAKFVENDIFGNNWNGLHLSNNPEVKVYRNRIQVTNDYAVAVLGVKQCALDENIFYTGVVAKTIHVDRNSKSSVHENTVLPHPLVRQNEAKHRDVTTQLGSPKWILVDPIPRPHIELPPALPATSVHHVTSITKVTVPADNTCEQGSKFCVIV